MAEQTLVICFPQDGMHLSEPLVPQSYDNDEVKVPLEEHRYSASPGSATPYWRRNEIVALLDLYQKYQPEFNTAHYRDKSRIWGVIAKEMTDVGFAFTGFACHKKFRNMKTRYKSIVEAMQKKGSTLKPTWPYFGQMDDIISQEREAIPISLEDAMTSMGTEEGDNTVMPAATLMHWGRREILLLLEAYERCRGEVSPTRHRPEIWHNVSREMEQHGYIIDAAACSKKVRNMANHFRSIVKSVQRSGGVIKPTWEYYHIMEKLVPNVHRLASSAEESVPYHVVIDNPESSECMLDLDVMVEEQARSVEVNRSSANGTPPNTAPEQGDSTPEQHSVSEGQRPRKRRRPNRGFGGLIEMLERKLDTFTDIMEDQNRLMRERNELLRQKVELKRQRLEWEKRMRR